VLCISVLLVAIDNTIVNVAPARRRTLFFVVCGELAAGAHSPVRSAVKDFSPGQQ
jgi:hypothetical protein